MLWSIGVIIVIGIIAAALKKGIQGTRFVNNCGCTPNIDHLRYMEEGGKKKEDNLW